MTTRYTVPRMVRDHLVQCDHLFGWFATPHMQKNKHKNMYNRWAWGYSIYYKPFDLIEPC